MSVLILKGQRQSQILTGRDQRGTSCLLHQLIATFISPHSPEPNEITSYWVFPALSRAVSQWLDFSTVKRGKNLASCVTEKLRNKKSSPAEMLVTYYSFVIRFSPISLDERSKRLNVGICLGSSPNGPMDPSTHLFMTCPPQTRVRKTQCLRLLRIAAKHQ